MVFKVNNTTVIDDNKALSVSDLQLNTQNSVISVENLSFQGELSGFVSGGYGPPPNVIVNVIQKFPFPTDGNATDVGDLAQATFAGAGQSASDYSNGYATSSIRDPSVPPGSPTSIQKFSFVSGTNAFIVGQTSIVGRQYQTGQSSSTKGYNSGGYTGPSGSPPGTNVIDSFPFATDGNATDVGDLTVVRHEASGQSSSTHGYTSGGYSPPAGGSGTFSNVIDKFPFATNANATDVGDLTNFTEPAFPSMSQGATGQSSITFGYHSGGGPNTTNKIDKFPFSSDSNSTSVGTLTSARQRSTGQSSTLSGYTSGGISTPGVDVNIIDKFPFATDGNATDVGDLLTVGREAMGHQF